MKGVIRKIVVERGFLFIQGEDRQSYFCHHTACQEFYTLVEGARVAFDVTMSDKGLRAEHIVKV